jgi:hypothetical protein
MDVVPSEPDRWPRIRTGRWCGKREVQMSDVSVAKSAGLAGGATPARIERWGRSAFLAATGCFALAVGVLVYLTDRGVSQAMLIPTLGALAGSNAFGVLGQWLPSFVHPFSFSLFTAAALPSCSVPRYGACAVWCAVNVAFEVGQHPRVSAHVTEALQGTFGRNPLTRPLANYFLRGTFDVGDIVAAIVGALAAAGVLRLMQRGSETQHAQ